MKPNTDIVLDGDTLELLPRTTTALRAAGVPGIVLDPGDDGMSIFRGLGESEAEGAAALLELAHDRRVEAVRLRRGREPEEGTTTGR
jgi:hypothetical protein